MKKSIILLLALCVLTPGHADILVWTNTAGGNWSDASGWNPNTVPGAADDAVITNTGTYVVTLDVSPTINSLSLGGAGGRQTLAAAGNNLTLNSASTVMPRGLFQLSGGVLNAAGTLTLQGQIEWTAGRFDTNCVLTIATNGLLAVNAGDTNAYLDFSGIITNHGTLVITNGGLRCIAYNSYGGGYGLIMNAVDGVIDLQNGSHLDFSTDNSGTGTPEVINYGTVQKSSGNDVSFVKTPVFNVGTLDAKAGTISLQGGGKGSGIFQAEPGATVDYPADYEVDGTITGAGTNLVEGGLFTLDGTVTGHLVWTGGEITPGSSGTVATNGRLTVNPGDGAVYLDFTGVLTNYGTIAVTNGGIRCIVWNSEGGGSGLLANAPGGLIDLQSAGFIEYYNDNTGPGLPAVVNYGTLRKSSGTNAAVIKPPLYNFGTVAVQAGSMGIDGGGNGNGIFQAAAGTALNFDNDYEIDSSLSGAGTNFITHGTFTLNGRLDTTSVFLTGDAILEGTNGIIADNVTWYTPARVGINSVLTVATNGVLRADGGDYAVQLDFSGVLTNNGTITITNGGIRCIVYNSYGGGYGLLVNAAGGLIDLQTNSSIGIYNDTSGVGAPALINYGTVRKSNGTDTNLISTPFTNLGTLDAETGLIELNGGYDLSGGTLNFGISSLTNFGQIYLAGNATLTGTVSAMLNNGYQPLGGNLFPVLTYDSAAGIFTNATLPFADAWQTNYDVSVFSLLVLNARPTLLTNASQVVKELTSLAVTNLARDPDIPAQNLSFRLLSPLAGMNIGAASGVFTWTPAQTQSSATNTVAVVVTDNGTPPLSATNTFQVVVREVNVAPSLPLVTTQTVNELTLLSVTNTGTNFNIHSVVTGYRLVSPPSNMVISASGIITWTPAQAQSPATNVITTVVTNSNPYDLVNPSLTSTNQFTVIVKEVNVAPVLSAVPTQTVNEMALLSVTNTAVESNIHSTVGYALVNPPTGMNISASGVITWTPGVAQSPGTNLIMTIVTNSNPYDLVNPHPAATNSFTVIVYAPALAAIGNYTVNAGQTVTFTNSATDNDPTRTLTFSLASQPAGATVTPGTGVFTWRPTTSQAGTTNVLQVRVADNSAPPVTDTKSFTVIVQSLAPVTLTALGNTNAQFKLRINGSSGPDYIISASTNLIQWTDLVTNLAPATPFQYGDTNILSRRFYRVRLSP